MIFFCLGNNHFYSSTCEFFINGEGCLALRSSGARGEELTEPIPFFEVENPTHIIRVTGSRTRFKGKTTNFTSNECVYPLYNFGYTNTDLDEMRGFTHVTDEIREFAVNEINDYAHNKTKVPLLTADPVLAQPDGTYTLDPSADICFESPINLSREELDAVFGTIKLFKQDGANVRGHEFYDVYDGLICRINVHNLCRNLF